MKIVKGGMITILDATPSELSILKDILTIDNPAYIQAKKYSRYKYIAVPPKVFYYTQIGKDFVIPRGVSIPLPHTIIQDDRITKTVKYPKFKFELRDAQRRAYEAWKQDTDKGLIVLQTGLGKSILGIYIACATKQKTLIIVHKDDLVDGWREDIKLTLGLEDSDIGIIKAGKKIIGEQITIATIQTLSRQTPTYLEELYNTFGLVITDECHRAPSKTFEHVKYFQCKYLIGLTATDMRNDGLGEVLYWYFGDVCYRHGEDTSGDILPYRVKVKEINYLSYAPPREYYCGNRVVDEEEAIHLKSIGKFVKRKSLDPQVLKEFLKDPKYLSEVSRDVLREFKNGESILCFLHEKEHIRQFKEALISVGIPENQIQLYYGDSKEKDSVLKKRAESKEVLVTLATFAKATEGTNVKSWERLFLVTSINNEKNTIQSVGRVRRSKVGKTDVIVYDYRFPNIQGLSSHGKTRDIAYKTTNGTVTKTFKKLTSRGFRIT